MARRKYPKGQLNKGKNQVFKALHNLMEDLGEKYSVRVGIIGKKAYEKHEHTDLTYAQLGAIHEFGATINMMHPGGTPYKILDNGKAQFVSKKNGTGLPVTKAHEIQITIPARSFLRFLIKKDGQNLLTARIKKQCKAEGISLESMPPNKVMNAIANITGAVGLRTVQDAFIVGGYPKNWTPITEFTKEHRQGDKSSPPLTDTGALMNSITFEVKKHG